MSAELSTDLSETMGGGNCHNTTGANDLKRTQPLEARPHGKLRKRRKKSSQSKSLPDVQILRSEVHRNAESLRREGISPDTLFFPSLSDDIKRDDSLRTAVGVPLENLKTTHVRGKKMAWAKFETESDCLDALLRLKLANPAMKVSLHRPKRVTDSNGMSLVSNNVKVFQRRLQEVRGNGGVGNTLMFRNFPVEIECEEVREILTEAVEKSDCQHQCVPLRIRTALSKNGNSRNFWVVYSDVVSCQAAFVAIHLTSVRFRCGRNRKIHAFIHDDSTDADEKRRRERAIELVERGHGNARTPELNSSAQKISNLHLLENLLRQNRTKFVFMSPKET